MPSTDTRTPAAAKLPTILVIGASGATGHLLVAELLNSANRVKAVVRSPQALPENLRNHAHLTIVQASILELDDTAMTELVQGCQAIASCLGHNLTFKGLFGHPRKLVTEATRRLCEAVYRTGHDTPVRFVLMNTTANRNRDLAEPRTLRQKIVFGLVRALLPPHADNEHAAEYLRTVVGQKDRHIEWAAVRPDTLVDQDHVTEYDIHPSPTHDPVFEAGKTSRINVARFMATLINDDDLWQTWKGRMPVIYNRG